LDLSAYHNLSFEVKGKGTFEVVLVKKSINAWEQQFRTTIKIDENSKTITLPFADFRSTAATKFDARDLLSVVIAAKGDNKANSDFEISAADLRFSKNNAALKNNIKTFPNPASDVVNVEFDLQNEGDFDLSLFDVNGKNVYQSSKNGKKGLNQATITVNNLNNGLYYCFIQQGAMKTSTKVLVIKN
jgi:hypothetical protein